MSHVTYCQVPGACRIVGVRRAAAWTHAGELRLRIDFAAGWSGDHLYALDWDNRERRQTVTVDDGSGPRVAVLDSAFTNGLWTHAPVAVPAGGSGAHHGQPHGRHERRPLGPVPGRRAVTEPH